MQREEKRTKLVSRIQVLTSLTSETEREKRKRENFGLAHKMGGEKDEGREFCGWGKGAWRRETGLMRGFESLYTVELEGLLLCCDEENWKPTSLSDETSTEDIESEKIC